MDGRRMAQLLALGRAAVGTAFLVAPERMATAWVGESGRGTAGRVIARSLGVRDLLLGAGLLAALREGDGAAAWLWCGAAADAVDGIGAAANLADLPFTGRLSLPTAFGAAALGVLLARRRDVA